MCDRVLFPDEKGTQYFDVNSGTGELSPSRSLPSNVHNRITNNITVFALNDIYLCEQRKLAIEILVAETAKSNEETARHRVASTLGFPTTVAGYYC